MAHRVQVTLWVQLSAVADADRDRTFFFSGIIAAAIGGVIAQALGYQGVFIISLAIALVSIAIVAREFDRTRRTQLTPQIE
ncbi:hypothetical protein QUB70_02330 [Microcoleus sp. A003_D6]|uniref:hypothetical protein n=1 Tax=Microcoleus sp. A003_D6 TaxID=3055266 RepID=UPI002FD16CAE